MWGCWRFAVVLTSARNLLGPKGGGQIGLEYLERHFAVVSEIRGQVDGRHSTFTKRALDSITALEGRVQSWDRIPVAARHHTTERPSAAAPLRRLTR